ncbi:hypothetical protein Leryth_015023, partial [Lithospermum erythrorhizon]
FSITNFKFSFISVPTVAMYVIFCISCASGYHLNELPTWTNSEGSRTYFNSSSQLVDIQKRWFSPTSSTNDENNDSPGLSSYNSNGSSCRRCLYFSQFCFTLHWISEEIFFSQHIVRK